MGDERLSGFFHREFGFLVGGVWFGFAACEDFQFAERAKDKLNHISRAALVVVVAAWANATDQANPRAFLDHALNSGDDGGREDRDAMPDSMVRDGV
jgi:predicted amidohydrolase